MSCAVLIAVTGDLLTRDERLLQMEIERFSDQEVEEIVAGIVKSKGALKSLEKSYHHVLEQGKHDIADIILIDYQSAFDMFRVYTEICH
jgi:hypothetical protein